MFVGGLDPSVDKDTLVKLFGMVPNMVSLDMDMDANNNFRVFLNLKLNTRELLLLFIKHLLMLKLPSLALITRNWLSTIFQ